MSFPLFRATAKANLSILVIFALILCLYIVCIIALYDPESTQAMEEMLRLIPEEMTRAMGFESVPSDLAGFIGSYFYGMLVFLIPLIYVSILGNRLVAKSVDNGSMAYFLSTPVTRARIAVTQGVFFLSSIAVLFAVLVGFAVLACRAMFPGRLDIGAFVRLNACALLLTFAISAICWFFSCLFSDVRYSLGFGAGIPVFLFLLNVFSGTREAFSGVSFLSVYGLFDAQEILAGAGRTAGLCLFFALMTLALYGAGVWIFTRKDLPI